MTKTSANTAPKTEAKTDAKKDAPKKRVSRIAPLQEKVVTMLQKSSATVVAMAAKFEVPERDIRLAIDRARTKGHDIHRVAKGEFGFLKK